MSASSEALRTLADSHEAIASSLRAIADQIDAETTVDESHLLTVRQVADRLSVHPNTVHSMIQSGELAASKVRNQWRVTPVAVARLMIRRVS